jgi:hypothetical protein
MSMSPVPQYSFASRLMAQAEKAGYKGEGAFTLPVMTDDGRGRIGFVVSKDDLDDLPANAVVYNPETGSFHQQRKGEDGNTGWQDLGSNPNINEITGVDGYFIGAPAVTKPLPQPEKPEDVVIEDPTITNNVDAPAGAQNNGKLFAGTGNPIGKMIVASNGELALAGAIRFYKDNEIFDAEIEEGQTPKYVLNLRLAGDETKDWIFVYSASLEDDKYGKNIGSLYNLELQVRNITNGKVMRLRGVNQLSKNRYLFEGQGVSIADNEINEGKLVQNIQRVSFYKNVLSPELGEETESPIGDYEFTLTATRKVGKAKPVVLKFAAAVADFKPDDVSFITSPVKSNNGTVPAPGLKPNGDLLIGNNNRNTLYVTAKNGELALAGACRWYNTGAAFAPQVVDGIPFFNFNLYEGTSSGVKDWNWHYSYVLENNTNADGILDLYDISMTIKDLGSGNELVATGEFEAGVFKMALEGTPGITDNATTPEGSVCQNIQRITFYKDLLGDVQLGENTGSPVGDFEFKLLATRKIGEVPPLELVWRAHVVDEAPPPPEPEPDETPDETEEPTEEPTDNP